VALLSLVLAPATALADDVTARAVPGIRVFKGEDGVPQSTVRALAFEPGGRLWIGTQAGPAYYDGRGFTRLALPPSAPSSMVRALVVGRDGKVWIGTTGGGILSHLGGRFTEYGEASGLPSLGVVSLLEATVGGATAIWAGTRVGLARLSGDRFVPVDLGPKAR
jgi:ligand-binding sensor domain-containing protein